MGGICAHMFIRVSCAIIPIPVEALPLVRQWSFYDGVGEGVSANRVKGVSRPG